jgi:hypothetical protein
MSSITEIQDITVHSNVPGEYKLYVEAWLGDRIQKQAAKSEEPAEFTDGLCYASTYVSEPPPTNPDALTDLVYELNTMGSFDWVDADMDSI